MNGDLYFPPYQPPFPDLEHAQAGGGGPVAANFVNGHPYDLIDDVPVTSFSPVQTDSYAKGGAVHYSGPRVKGSYPTIDRAFYYAVDDGEVITQSYWGVNFDVYFQTLVKSDEASIWGYKSDGYEFKAVANASKASLEAYGDSKFIIISTEDLTNDDQPLAKFREVMGGDMKKRFFLCTDPGDGDPQCEDLADPLVRNIYAQYIGSHPHTGPCVGSETYVDFAKSFIQVATDGDPSTKVTVEPNKIWVSDIDQSLSVESHAINIVSSAGSSEFSDTYLHVSRNTGAYASFDGAGWLELKNSAGKVIYLDPDQIVFTDGSKTATHNADGFTAVNGSSNFAYYRSDVANLVTSSNEGEFRADRLTISQTSGNVSAQLTVNSGSGTLSVENSLGGKGVYQATLAKLEDSIGDSTLTTQSLHINGSAGSHATFNGSGWLQLKNAAGKVIDLNPDQIVFTDGSKTATHNADGFTAVDGTSYTGSVMANSIGVTSNSGNSDLSDTYLQINSTGGSHATFNGSGWLQLKNAAGKVIYLDPTQIVFTDGSRTATHNADGYTAINGSSYFAYYRSDVANLVTSSNEGSFRADRLELTQTSGGVSAILSVNSGSGTLSVENSLGGTGTYQATLAQLDDSNGDSTLTTQSLHINSSGGGYATFNGSGWLELRNAAGKEIYLDPTQIVFTDGGDTSTLEATGLVVRDQGSGYAEFRKEGVYVDGGNGTGALTAQGVSIESGGAEGRVYAGGVYITNGNSEVTITPPGNNAFFQNIDFVDPDFNVQSIKVLSTEPITSGVFDPCQRVVTCVLDSEVFPTWSDTNATYVDWASFSQVPAYIDSVVTNALLRLGVTATCDSDGNLTVELTGVPQTSSNTPNWPSAPGVSA